MRKTFFKVVRRARASTQRLIDDKTTPPATKTYNEKPGYWVSVSRAFEKEHQERASIERAITFLYRTFK